MAAALASGLSQSVLAGRLAAAAGEVDFATLEAFLDVLLPADDVSPAASQLGVTAELLDLAKSAELYQKLLSLGSDWLNQTGRGPFYTLSNANQNKVVAWMSTSDTDQIPGRFYQLVRQSGVEIYYSHPEAINGFPLNPAPQPNGYLPPWQ